MADRNVRDAIILSKAESTYATDPTPDASTDALEVTAFSVTLSMPATSTAHPARPHGRV